MIDTTAWARQGDPANKGWGRDIIEAQRLGQQGAIEREVNERQRRVFDLEMAESEKKIADQIGVKNLGNQMLEAWKAGDTKGFDEANRRMALIDPGKAKEAYSMYGTMDRTNFNNSAWAFAGASSLPMGDIESQNAMLRKAKDLLGNDNHFFAQQLDELMAMPEGEKRTEGLIAGMNLLEKLGAFGKTAGMEKTKKQKTGTYLVEDKKTGEKKFITGVFDPITGGFVTAEAGLPEDYEVLSKEGETTEEATARRVRETKEKKQVETAIKSSADYAKQAEGMNRQIGTLEQGIALAEKAISEGESLGRGWLENRLPKLSDTKLEFENIANQLGLDVVSSVTFGALSESELKMALETAMPNFPRDEDTLNWMKQRRDVLAKLRNYYKEAAAYLGQGNTIADWEKMQLEKAKQDDAQFKKMSTEDLLKTFSGGS